MSSIAVACSSETFIAFAAEKAEFLKLPLMGVCELKKLREPSYCLWLDDLGWSLQQTGKKAPGPVRVDFTAGSVAHRRHFGGGKGQMIAKAVGVSVKPSVFDATAGLAKDAFVLASLGCRLSLLERSPVVHCLLEDGLARANEYAEQTDPELLSIVQRMSLAQGDALTALQSLAAEPTELRPDVVYLDPMFPERQKSAQVKKDMKLFHDIVGADTDADALLAAALAAAVYRVVVKRPKLAGYLADTQPSYQLDGKSGRFDVYTLKKLEARS